METRGGEGGGERWKEEEVEAEVGRGWLEWGSERCRGRRRDGEVKERREGKVGGRE